MIPEVVTERLRLRAPREDDLDALAAMLADEEVARFLGGVQSREDAWRFLALSLGHWTLRGYGWWTVCSRSSEAVLGRCGLWFPEGWPEPEVGWAFARHAWGHGYATEAAYAAVQFARASVGLARIASLIVPENTRSLAVASRLGMAYDREVEVRGVTAGLYARAL